NQDIDSSHMKIDSFDEEENRRSTLDSTHNESLLPQIKSSALELTSDDCWKSRIGGLRWLTAFALRRAIQRHEYEEILASRNAVRP
ncbi:hypothetical protein PMAYCL1PPCAC_25302, partial [Pristionchus mayeri]